jgi:hypothetical protein
LKVPTGWHWEIACLLVFLLLTGMQLFLRPITGLADNGDFPKVLGPRNVCDPNHERDAYKYVYAAYVIDFSCGWGSHITSSEVLFVRAIKRVTLWQGRKSFPVTASGAAHLPVLATALLFLLGALHGCSRAVRFGIPPLAIFIFSDVAYVAGLNSFYMDTASMLFLLAEIALAVRWVLRPRTWVAVAFGGAGVLLAFSKTQHVLCAGMFAGLAGWFAVDCWRRGTASRRPAWCWSAAGAAIFAAVVIAIGTAPPDLHSDPTYNLIFYRFLPESARPIETLTQLGLPEAYQVYSGTNAYNRESPMADPAWRGRFGQHFGFRNITMYYARNPGRLVRQLRGGLEEAANIRPAYLANYRKEDGFAPTTLARRFDWWSTMRSGLLRRLPFHVVALYLVLGVGSLGCVFANHWAKRYPLYPLVLVATLSGAIEFTLAVSLDVLETPRHLFIFHVLTEILILCAAAALLSWIPGESTRTTAGEVNSTR